MFTRLICFLGVLLGAAPHYLSADINHDGKTVICFVAHTTSHGFGNHEYLPGCHLIEEWLKQAYPEANIEGRFAVPWPEDEETFFKDADCVVFFCSGGTRHVVNGHVPAFDNVMRRGAGLACLHYAVEVPIGPSAKGMLAWMGGYFEKHWSVNPHWVAQFERFPTDHPAANGIKPFKADDEWYFHMRFRSGMQGVTPILSALAPDSTMARRDGPHSGNPAVRKAVANREPQHVAWAYQRGGNYNHGRGYGFTGLHYHWNWQDDNFRKTVLNGVAWATQLEIPENGVEVPTPTKEYLSANVIKWAGEQNRRAKNSAASAKVDPNAKAIYRSEVVKSRVTEGHAVHIAVDLPNGARQLWLRVDPVDGKAFDWANWAEARFVLADGKEKNLSEIDWISAASGWGQVRKNLNAGGRQMKVMGKAIQHGIGTHAPSVVGFEIPRGAKKFLARGVLDDGGASQGKGEASSSVRFEVFTVNPGAPEQAAASGEVDRNPDQAVASLEVHPELEVQLFASEPMIASPSSIDIDAKGRVWVCDVVNYRRNQGKREGGDQILILEDTDGDARADKKTVFYQGHDVDSAHGICVLGDRVIISAGDEIFSLYDRNSDGKADPGSKKVMFSNIGGKQHDHGIHAVHFGPDGKLYFNYGNAGRRLCDPKGRLITDINGIPCQVSDRPYRQGMIFRCELDGSRVEMLGWNFRNNWELCVDAFGTMWQSDNDDDGNKGVRINYVMDYGNYGYRDEITGAGWRDPRPGMSEEIPRRHWHQNDPGVVPNLLQTGAGSPTGIFVYEGELLPEIFHDQVIHCDAGPNVVRAYPVKADGAGYSAVMVDLLKARTDKWFRPSDVCTAPDDSLFVADWYDPGVGGHGMRDIERGRIFRIIPKGNESAKKYTVAEPDYRTADGALEALTSANMSTRFEGWSAYRVTGAMPPVHENWTIKDLARVCYRINAADPLGFDEFNVMIEGAASELNLTEEERDSLNIVMLRAMRSSRNQGETLKAVEALSGSTNPQVLRECALSLRHYDTELANQLWARLALAYDGQDRWYLEALGIGADPIWDNRLAALGEREVHSDIIWRSRGKDSARRIAEVIVNKATDRPAYIRALHFQENAEDAYRKVFLEADKESSLLAAGKLGSQTIEKLDGGEKRLESLIGPIRGTDGFVELADRLKLTGFATELIDFIIKHPGSEKAVTAARLVMEDNRYAVTEVLRGDDLTSVELVAAAVAKSNDRYACRSFLPGFLKDKKVSAMGRKVIANAMVTSNEGARSLIDLVSKGQLADELKPGVALGLARHPDGRIRSQAAEVLPPPKAPGAGTFPGVEKLVAMKGSAANGKSLYKKATCATCHLVQGEGINFGPDLSEIGNKLSREGMFQAILYPSAAISHGFHGLQIELKDGSSMVGFSTGETDTEVQVRLPGGVQQNVAKEAIASQKAMDQSLMPPGLANLVGVQGLVDLVTWLETLK